MASLADLRTKVAANTTVISGAITLIRGLKQKLDEAIAANDPAAIQSLSDELDVSAVALAAALAANTPGAAPPEVPPVEPETPSAP